MTERAALIRYDYYKGPKSLGDFWTLTRGPAQLRCTGSTHAHGWEVRLVSGSNVLRKEVIKTESDVYATVEAWLAEARTKGWV